jgi:hypothetical protein
MIIWDYEQLRNKALTIPPTQSCLEREPEHRPSAVGILDYLDGKCTLKRTKENSGPILLDKAIIAIIKQNDKVNGQQQQQQQPEGQSEEVKLIQDFLLHYKPAKRFNLRTFFFNGNGLKNETNKAVFTGVDRAKSRTIKKGTIC